MNLPITSYVSFTSRAENSQISTRKQAVLIESDPGDGEGAFPL